MQNHFILLLATLGSMSLTAWGAPPSEVYNLPKVVAVQNRAFNVEKEATMQIGYLPSDAFNKGYTVGASYTTFFSDFLGWEVVNANYSFNSPTHLKKDLLDCCSVQVQNVGFDGVLDFVQWYVTTNMVYTPLYTKSLLFNKSIVRGEISFAGGAGAAKFADSGMRLLISLGLYFRFFQNESRSWKFDFRNNVYFEKSLGAVNSMSLMVGYTWQIGKASKQKSSEELDEL